MSIVNYDKQNKSTEKVLPFKAYTLDTEIYNVLITYHQLQESKVFQSYGKKFNKYEFGKLI